MDELYRDRVGKALDHLKVGLRRFVEAEFTAAFQDQAIERARQYPGERPPDGPFSTWDVAALLRVMEEAWNDIFRRKLGRPERSLVVELRQVRNRWAHQQDFSRRDAFRAIDSMQRLLAAISAPEAEQLEPLLEMNEAVPTLGAAASDATSSPAATQEDATAPSEAPTEPPLLTDEQFASLRRRALELEGISATARRSIRRMLPLLLADAAGFFLLGRWLANHHVSLWFVVPGCLIGFHLVNIALGIPVKRSVERAKVADKEFAVLAARFKIHKEELERCVEEELPVLPSFSVLSEIDDPFLKLVALGTDAGKMAVGLRQHLIREKTYPSFLRQALAWWTKDRHEVDAYVQSHREEILANAKDIEQEFTSDMNFAVDMDGCRRVALWALRNAGEEVRYYLPEMNVAPNDVGVGSPEVLQLARIIRTWGGHKHELLLPRARGMWRSSPLGAGDAGSESIREKLKRAAGRATSTGQSSQDLMATLRGLVEIEVEHGRASGMSQAELERLRSEGIESIEDILKALQSDGTSRRT